MENYEKMEINEKTNQMAMQSLPTLVLIHGFARTGKTTLLQQLKQRGYHCYSSSQELDDIVCERVKPEFKETFVRHLRQKDDFLCLASSQKTLNKPLTCRELKIDTAENWYIPMHGRHSLVKRTLVRQKPKSNYKKQLAFFETVGGEEAEIIKQYYKGDTISINLRAENELKGVDIRQLDNEAPSVFNSMLTPESFCDYFLKRVNECLDN